MDVASVSRVGTLAPAAGRSAVRAAAFEVPGPELAGTTARSTATAGLRPTLAADALLALQGGLDLIGELRRRRSIQRGRGVLDALDVLKAGLLDGAVSQDALAGLRALLADAEPTGDAGLDQLLAEIDLRARVELAKLGQEA